MRPTETRMVQIAGRGIYVRVQGDGPAVLLLHGIPTHGQLWDEVGPRLAAAARVIVPDLLGFGRSAAPAGLPVDIASHAAYMGELLDALGTPRATVVGHDIGGGIAQILAAHHRGRVERLGLVNSACYDAWPVPGMRAIQAAAPLVKQLPARLVMRGIRRGLRRGFVHSERADAYLERFVRPFSTPDGLRRFVNQACALDNRHTQAVAPLLPTLRVPVEVIWGTQDPFLETRWAERLASEIPTAELARIPDASHFAPADAPAEVAAAILRLLRRPTDTHSVH